MSRLSVTSGYFISQVGPCQSWKVRPGYHKTQSVYRASYVIYSFQNAVFTVVKDYFDRLQMHSRFLIQLLQPSTNPSLQTLPMRFRPSTPPSRTRQCILHYTCQRAHHNTQDPFSLLSSMSTNEHSLFQVSAAPAQLADALHKPGCQWEKVLRKINRVEAYVRRKIWRSWEGSNSEVANCVSQPGILLLIVISMYMT